MKTPQDTSPICVLGDGGWGTALALVLCQGDRRVRLWSHDPAYARILDSTRRNPKFLPGVTLPRELTVGSDPESLLRDVRRVVSVVPTQFVRRVLERIAAYLPPDGILVSCSKGFERETLLLPTRILREFLPGARTVVLSGPSHAEEVSKGLPATVVAASDDADAAREVQEMLTCPTFRVYTSSDPTGVEVGGAAKNIIALAAGISDGLGFGDNARAGLITRGLREITRLGIALGAMPETFSGLSGMGDLIATCTSTHSRNHTVGYRVGRGAAIEDVLLSTEKVAEGVETTRSVLALADRIGIDVPITREVYAVLFEKKPPRDAVGDLMSREAKEELR